MDPTAGQRTTWDPAHDPTDDQAVALACRKRKDVRRTLWTTTSVALVTFGAAPALASSVKNRAVRRTSPGYAIVFPGKRRRRSHTKVFGNTTTNASSTYASMLGKPTTCPLAGDRRPTGSRRSLNSAGQRTPHGG